MLPKISLTASTGCPQPPAGDPNLGRAGLLHPKTWGGFGVPSLEASSTRGGDRPPPKPGGVLRRGVLGIPPCSTASCPGGGDPKTLLPLP